MVVGQGDIWWADLGTAVGSAPGFHRPVLVVQGNMLNRGRIRTVICVALTGTVKWGDAIGNVVLTAAQTGLEKPSVANVSQIVTLDRSQLLEWVGRVADTKLEQVFKGIDLVLGR